MACLPTCRARWGGLPVARLARWRRCWCGSIFLRLCCCFKPVRSRSRARQVRHQLAAPAPERGGRRVPSRHCAILAAQPLDQMAVPRMCPAGCQRGRQRSRSLDPGLFFDERALDHEVAGLGGVALFEIALFQNPLERSQHLGATAQHDAVSQRVQRGHTEVGEQLAVFN